MRIPEDIDQAINYVSQLEKIEKTQSLRKLARLGFEYYDDENPNPLQPVPANNGFNRRREPLHDPGFSFWH